ncbi:MAG TPA: VOC family protein [Flavitalea sp.]|nr:VOC family protein [Flavitalea sp.]
MNNDLKNIANVKQAVPFFMVIDMTKSLDFYIKGLGFELKHKWEPEGRIEWCWLQFDDASIMMQEYRTNIPTEKRGEGVSVCFICEDALKIYKEMISHGLSTSSEPFVGNNMWVIELKDPDGYNILFESATDVPEGTKYSEWAAKQH